MNFKYYKRGPLLVTVLVLSILLTKLINNIEPYINRVETLKQINDIVGAFSMVGLLGLILLLIDKYFWKYKIFSWLIDVPNLNGRYIGSLFSNYGSGVHKDCVIEIYQTASIIKLYCYFGDFELNDLSSESCSFTEEIIKEHNGLQKLYYTFKNNSENNVELNDHEGAGVLSYYDDIFKLEGPYFNRRGNSGKISVTFQQKKLLKRFK